MYPLSYNLNFSILLVSFFSFFVLACSGQNKPLDPNDRNIIMSENIATKKLSKRDTLLMQVLRRIYKDSSSNLHIVGDAYYYKTKDTLMNLSDHEYFKKSVIRQLVEDSDKNIWIATYDGLVKFTPSTKNGKPDNQFIRLSTDNGLIHPDIWSITIDNTGLIWIGTLEGISTYDGKSFTSFSLPDVPENKNRGVSSSKLVHSITQDSKGNMWFGTNGGAYIYDGDTITNLSEQDGLCNNSVNHILEDKKGNIWFATHHDGVCYWDGTNFTNITQQNGMHGQEVWSLFQDLEGSMWFPVENQGVYRYKDGSLDNFHIAEGLPLNGVHTIAQDKNGHYWFGGFEGLYKYDGQSFKSITKQNLSEE